MVFPRNGADRPDSLRGFCNKTKIDLERAREVLRKRGIAVKSSKETLAAIAAINGISPKDVFAAIKDLKQSPDKKTEKKNRMTADEVFERYEGTGVGRMTVAEACSSAGQKLAACERRLLEQGIAFHHDDTLKNVSDKNQLLPIQVLQRMLAE